MCGCTAKRVLWIAFLVMTNFSAAACPVCNTDTGQQVRQGIFNREFGGNLLRIVAPFPVVLGVALVAANRLGREEKQ